MNLLYIIKEGGSRWDDNELRYSLRSVEKHGQNVDKVIICGHKPSWVQNVVHATLPDPHPLRYDNTWFKMKTMCTQNDAPFVLMNDDFFLIKPVDFDTLPDYYDGDVSQLAEKYQRISNYVGVLYATKHLLVKNGYPHKNYAVHYPMTVKPEKIRPFFGLLGETPGISFRLLYGNVAATNPSLLPDCKYNQPTPDIQEQLRLRDVPMFSIGDGFLDIQGKEFLANTYPHKSKYEI